MLNYRTTRDDSEQIIRMLCEHYPKCFFENPRQRRPLKKNIDRDIIDDKNFEVAPELITAALEWYCGHVGYDYAATAGVKRVDLSGNEVGTVTEQEAITAKSNVIEKNKEIEKQRRSPVDVLNKMHATGRVTDDGVKKLDYATPTKTKATAIAPEFASIYETLTIANTAVSGISDPTIRLAVAKGHAGRSD